MSTELVETMSKRTEARLPYIAHNFQGSAIQAQSNKYKLCYLFHDYDHVSKWL